MFPHFLTLPTFSARRNPILGPIAVMIYLTVTGILSAAPPRFQFNHDAFTHQIQELLRQNTPLISIHAKSGKVQTPAPTDLFYEEMNPRSFLRGVHGGRLSSR